MRATPSPALPPLNDLPHPPTHQPTDQLTNQPGVKYLHEAAHGADLGLYFESNGHGTVLFSGRLRERLAAAVSGSGGETG